MKNIKIVIIAIVFLAAGFLLGQNYSLPKVVKVQNQKQEQQPINNTVTYIINSGTGELKQYQNVEFTEGQTVLDVLKKVAQENNLTLVTKDYENLGTLVTKIGDQENNQSNKYWQYFVNNEQPQVGAGSYQLSPNERIEWRFEESKY